MSVLESGSSATKVKKILKSEDIFIFHGNFNQPIIQTNDVKNSSRVFSELSIFSSLVALFSASQKQPLLTL